MAKKDDLPFTHDPTQIPGRAGRVEARSRRPARKGTSKEEFWRRAGRTFEEPIAIASSEGDVPFTHKAYPSPAPTASKRRFIPKSAPPKYSYQGMTAEWAAELARGAELHGSILNAEIAESSLAYLRGIESFKTSPGVSARQASEMMQASGWRLSGSGRRVVLSALYRESVKDPVLFDELRRTPWFFPDLTGKYFNPAQQVQSAEFMERWNREALANKLAASALHRPVFSEYYTRKASEAGISGLFSEYLEFQQQFHRKPVSKVVEELTTSPKAIAREVMGSRWLKWGAAGAAAILGINLLFSGSDDDYNTIEALPHRGVAGRTRREVTDFGSGYQGLPSSLMGIPINARILKFRTDVWDDEAARAEMEAEIKERELAAQKNIGVLGPSDLFSVDLATSEGINLRRDGLKAVRLSKFVLNVEDADTIMLRRRGFLPWLKNALGMEGEVTIRLAGIDAPEVAAHKGDPLAPYRIFQSQPHGEAAAWTLKSILQDQDDLTLVVAENQKTYGRYLGAVLDSEGQNINLQLLRLGAASALPFGPSSTDVVDRRAAAQAENEAFQMGRGMWAYSRYQAAKLANREIGRVVTHNVLTRLDKLGANLNLGAYASFLEEMGGMQRPLSTWERRKAKQLGSALKKTHGPRQFGKFSGKDDNYLRTHGLSHKGIARKKRRALTAFGSGAIDAIFGGLANFMKKSASEVEHEVMGFLKKLPVAPGPSSVIARKNPKSLTELFEINISPEKITEPLRTSIVAHEISEYQTANKIVERHIMRNRPWVAKNLKPDFGSHQGVDPIVDELFISAKTGNFEAMKKFRLEELDALESMLKKAKDPTYRAQVKANVISARLRHNMKMASSIEGHSWDLKGVEKIRSKEASKLWEYRKKLREYKKSGGSMNPIFWSQERHPPRRPMVSPEATYMVKEWRARQRDLAASLVPIEPTTKELDLILSSGRGTKATEKYVYRARKIVDSFERKWLPRIRGFQTENAIKGISEGAAAKASRQAHNIPFESAWIKRALKMGIEAEKVAAAASKLGLEGAKVIETETSKWVILKGMESGAFGQVSKAVEAGTGRSAMYKHIGEITKLEKNQIPRPGGPVFSERLAKIIDQMSMEDFFNKSGPLGRELGEIVEAQDILGKSFGESLRQFGGIGAPHESAMQAMAFAERKGRNVAKVLGVEKSGTGFVMESAGRPLLPEEEAKALDWMVKEFEAMMSRPGEAVRHLDPHARNIMKRGNEYMIIDWGVAYAGERPAALASHTFQEQMAGYVRMKKMEIGTRGAKEISARSGKYGGKNHGCQQGKRGKLRDVTKIER